MTITILHGDCRDVLKTLPSDSFDCVVTSPPYWGLRDYGVDGQIGLEPTLAEHLSVMVAVFMEVRRVLKPAGTCWINYGDCYATTPNGRSASATKSAGNDDRTFRDKPFSTIQGVLKPKDLCMVSNRLAIALQEEGWWVRSEIVWHKPNPMPESIKDRPTCAHEKVWLLTKSDRYFYNAEAISEPATYFDITGMDETGFKNAANFDGKHSKHNIRGEKRDKQRGHSRRHAGFNDHWDNMEKSQQCSGMRNARNVWKIATRPFSDAHFATMPPELAERCIKAGCPEGGTILDPFGGAGTTGLVADRLRRNATLIELNPKYRSLAAQRIERDAPLFAEVTE